MASRGVYVRDDFSEPMSAQRNFANRFDLDNPVQAMSSYARSVSVHRYLHEMLFIINIMVVGLCTLIPSNSLTLLPHLPVDAQRPHRLEPAFRMRTQEIPSRVLALPLLNISTTNSMVLLRVATWSGAISLQRCSYVIGWRSEYCDASTWLRHQECILGRKESDEAELPE